MQPQAKLYAVLWVASKVCHVVCHVQGFNKYCLIRTTVGLALISAYMVKAQSAGFVLLRDVGNAASRKLQTPWQWCLVVGAVTLRAAWHLGTSSFVVNRKGVALLVLRHLLYGMPSLDATRCQSIIAQLPQLFRTVISTTLPFHQQASCYHYQSIVPFVDQEVLDFVQTGRSCRVAAAEQKLCWLVCRVLEAGLGAHQRLRRAGLVL
ncbi:hypothetical protein P171DRAFT_215575 [Karstenula rhodostoma CBS 690.94]|uniref:Uncharacterized protein n=1 Tax=Karstenula rhodostoma CBS 690.94 TaxID=1392251 RepID=A0A9P4PNW8_9PLEO|nr:hypothetical protein P171DRAFT_215575 [Karstenula rhodostoma CBS 690.94]